MKIRTINHRQKTFFKNYNEIKALDRSKTNDSNLISTIDSKEIDGSKTNIRPSKMLKTSVQQCKSKDLLYLFNDEEPDCHVQERPQDDNVRNNETIHTTLATSKNSRIKTIDRMCHEKQTSTNFTSNACGNMAADTNKKCKLMFSPRKYDNTNENHAALNVTNGDSMGMQDC